MGKTTKQLTQRQETFCIKYFELGNGTEAAIAAGYSRKIVRYVASQNLRKPGIKARIQELRQSTQDATVADVLKRKQILTEIARGRLTDFIECGQDGSWINIDSEKLNSAAIQAIDSKTEYDKNSAHPSVVTRIRLHNPIQAIAELNKMDGLYEPQNPGNPIVITTIEIVKDYGDGKPASQHRTKEQSSQQE